MTLNIFSCAVGYSFILNRQAVKADRKLCVPGVRGQSLSTGELNFKTGDYLAVLLGTHIRV